MMGMKPKRAQVNRYLKGLGVALNSSEALSEKQLRRAYEIFAVLKVPADQRLRFLRLLSRASRARRITLPRWDDDSWRISFAKDALTLARGTGGKLHQRIERLQRNLELDLRELEILWRFVRWDDELCERIREGNFRLASELEPAALLADAATVGVSLPGLFLTSTRAAFAAAGVPRGPARLRPNPLLIGLTASIGGVPAASRFVKTVRAGSQRMISGEPRAKELRRPVAQVKKAVDRYLGMLESDAVTVTETRFPHSVRALLRELYRQDRVLEGPEARHEDPEKQRRRRAQDLVKKLVEFANADLGNPDGSAPLWEATLLALIPNFYPQADFRASLQELQREVSRILRQVALADRWCNSDAFLRLWSNPSWNPPRKDRLGFEFFAERDLANDRTGIASTGEPVSMYLQWSWDTAQVARQRVPIGPRDSLLVAFDDAVALLDRTLTVRLCPVCRRLFVPRKRQLYWPNHCKQRANEFLRDHETRNRIRRELYAKTVAPSVHAD
jgi:hypothetical protein